MRRAAVVIGAALALASCNTRPPASVGRPCSQTEPCGPDAVCDLAQGVCVAAHVDLQMVFLDARRDAPADGTRPPEDLPAAPREIQAVDQPLSDLLQPDQRRPDQSAPTPDVSCATASAACWDVSGVLTKTDYDASGFPPKIFGVSVADNQTVHAFLDGAQDATYAESSEVCGLSRARTWHVERKAVSAASYKLLVRGTSDKDCPGGQPVSAGEIRVNAARGWKITQTIQCSVSGDTSASGGVLISTFCTVEQASGKISWQAGSTCGGCCGCPDGAVVNIEVVLSRP